MKRASEDYLIKHRMFECLVKRTKIMAHVENLNVDIMLLQETNLCKSDHLKLNRPWIRQIFQSKSNLVNFTPNNIITDSNCHSSIISGTLC